MKRYFRTRAGQWAAPSYGEDRPEGFPGDGTELAREVAKALGVPDLIVVDVVGDAPDPRPADESAWLHEPTPPPRPPEPPRPPSQVEELLEAIRQATDLADLKARAATIGVARRPP